MLELFVLNQSDGKIILSECLVKSNIQQPPKSATSQSFVAWNCFYNDFLPAAFTLAHRALAAAEIFARPAALIVDFFLTTDFAGGVLTFAQRAFCAAAILARAAALSFDFFFGAGAGVEVVVVEPRMEASSFSNALILSLMSAACFSCAEVRVRLKKHES